MYHKSIRSPFNIIPHPIIPVPIPVKTSRSICAEEPWRLNDPVNLELQHSTIRKALCNVHHIDEGKMTSAWLVRDRQRDQVREVDKFKLKTKEINQKIKVPTLFKCYLGNQ